MIAMIRTLFSNGSFWAAVAAVTALITTISSIVHQNSSVALHKKELTIKALIELESNVIDPLYHYTQGCIKEISKHPQSEDYKEITRYMDMLQIFAIGLDQKVYDERAFNKTEMIRLARIYLNIEPMIERKRSISGCMDYEALELLGQKLKGKYRNLR